MPQPPNLQKMLAEAQAMLAQQQEAQEALKSEKVDASTGGGSEQGGFDPMSALESLGLGGMGGMGGLGGGAPGGGRRGQAGPLGRGPCEAIHGRVRRGGTSSRA